MSAELHRHHHHHHPGHGHGGGHDHAAAVDERRLGLVALLTGLFMVLEAVGGLITGSLALIADAGHMLSDFAALALAWFAVRLARRPADWKRTYGFDRFSILVAFTNGIALFAIAIWIVAEAIQRLATPQPVLGGWMMAVAVAGLVINVFAFWILQGGSQSNLNVRAAVLHVAGDLLGSVAAIAAAGVIISTGWTPIDPLLSVLVSLLILRFAWRVVAESGHILLEGAPPGLDTRQIAEDLSENVAGVADVHHVHLWSITEARPMITLHARISRDHAAEATVAAIKTRLREKFGLGHATVEIERDACADAAGSDSAC